MSSTSLLPHSHSLSLSFFVSLFIFLSILSLSHTHTHTEKERIVNHKSYECHLKTAQRYEKERWLIGARGWGESEEDGQKVVSSNTEVRNSRSGVKRIGGGAIWPRRQWENEGGGGRGGAEGGREGANGWRGRERGGGGGGCGGMLPQWG